LQIYQFKKQSYECKLSSLMLNWADVRNLNATLRKMYSKIRIGLQLALLEYFFRSKALCDLEE